jgi:hypothetical protein
VPELRLHGLTTQHRLIYQPATPYYNYYVLHPDGSVVLSVWLTTLPRWRLAIEIVGVNIVTTFIGKVRYMSFLAGLLPGHSWLICLDNN